MASNANKSRRRVQTNANVGDKEVIALGGLIKSKKTIAKSRIPILNRIPIIGNIFKNESHENTETSLVIFMSPTIITPSEKTVNLYTENKAKFITNYSNKRAAEEREPMDPVYRWFFKPADLDYSNQIETFVQGAPIKKSVYKGPLMKSVEKEPVGAS